MKTLKGKGVLVTGGSGFLGTHLRQVLEDQGVEFCAPAHAAYDLTQQSAVRQMFLDLAPQVVFHLAGYVGGIWANKQRPADFFYRNLMMTTMVLHEAHLAGVDKLVTVIGGCSYPANAPNPIREETLWDGYPQAESAPYSLAKKMALVQSQTYRLQYGFNSVVLLIGNIYGPHDNFNLNDSHVIPALVRRFYEARRDERPSVTAWGTGRPVRDFIYARDAAEAIVLATHKYDKSDIINISSGEGVTIRELVDTVADTMGYTGKIEWDTTKPDGQIYKAFDVTRMREILGFQPQVSLRQGLRLTGDWFVANYEGARL